MKPFHAAAIQLCAGPDRDANLGRAEALVREAARRGAHLVALPEVFSWRGPRSQEPDRAEPIPGPTSRWMRGLARGLGIHLLGGSLLERPPHGRRAYNTSLLVAPSGRVLARYRKIHLFDVDIPGAVSVCESATRRPGRAPVAVSTPLGVLGLSICYDVRFPELYRRLVAAGAEVLLVPSAFTAPTGRAHWETLVRSRAIENQCYVIAPDQTGMGPNGECHGHSMIVDPWGRVLDVVESGDGVALARLEPEELARVRRVLPSLTHVRLGRRASRPAA
jgi:predicted amidohydrolase